MKRSILGVFIAMLIFVMGGCAKRATLLSDEELAQVFRDAFLSNAYVSSEGLKLDSLRLYDQIFENYGYTAADVQYTIGNFSKRKSARLGDVVERAISMLEEEGKRLDNAVIVMDTIDNISRRRTTQIIYSDTLIELRSKRDSTEMVIELSDITPGEYSIDFDYLIDSLDNYPKRYLAQYWFETGVDSDSTKMSRTVANSITLNKNEVQHVNRKIRYHVGSDRFVIRLADINNDDDDVNHHVTFKRLVVRHIPTVSDAHEILFNELTNLIILGQDGLFTTPKNSL